jgi:ABC-type lipoprotein export system ATPase subunit
MKKLIISNMSFAFNKHVNHFFHNVDLNFESGKIYFIEGKNGVGKSTLFSILQGTTPLEGQLSGSVIFDDVQYDITHKGMPTEVSKHVKTMVQDSNKMVVDVMTIAENLNLARLPKFPRLKLMPQKSRLPTMMTNLSFDLSSKVQKLSGGQKQILAIMMTLQKPARILLLDEPTAALDDKNSYLVMNFLNKIAQELDLIILVITHNKELSRSGENSHVITISTGLDETRSFKQIVEDCGKSFSF